MKKLRITATLVAILSSTVGWSGMALAFDFGVGNGCSAIEGIDATALTNGDTFLGRIGATGVSGFNKNGKPADNSDTDPFTDSIEECINDALKGYCTTIKNGDDSAVISVTPGNTSGKNGNRQFFTVEFLDVSSCSISFCSDQVDNDADTFTDYPNDPECLDYDDDDESA